MPDMQMADKTECIPTNTARIKAHTSKHCMESATENDQTPLVGRRILRSLGSNNRKMQMAARNEYGGYIDVTELLSKDWNEEDWSGKIATLFGASVFHNLEMVEDDGLEKEKCFVNFGKHPQDSVHRELEKQVVEAATKNLLSTEVKRLKPSTEKYKQIFKLRLGAGRPTKVLPMKLELDLPKSLVRVTIRKHRRLQRNFLGIYISHMLKIAFIKP